MAEYRFRTGNDGELVLQVKEYVSDDMRPGYYTHIEAKAVWRDATISDVPVFDPFNPPRDQYPGATMSAGHE